MTAGAERGQAVAVVMDASAFRAAVAEVVADAMSRLDAARASAGEKIAYTEAEAARLLSLNQHQLRDERRRGRITGSVIVGRQVRYTKDDLTAYLMRERTQAAG